MTRADFMDDEYIQDLLEWSHPYISNRNVIEYTEKEIMEMLRLPRKEC
jgi:protein SHQ1